MPKLSYLSLDRLSGIGGTLPTAWLGGSKGGTGGSVGLPNLKQISLSKLHGLVGTLPDVWSGWREWRSGSWKERSLYQLLLDDLPGKFCS